MAPMRNGSTDLCKSIDTWLAHDLLAKLITPLSGPSLRFSHSSVNQPVNGCYESPSSCVSCSINSEPVCCQALPWRSVSYTMGPLLGVIMLCVLAWQQHVYGKCWEPPGLITPGLSTDTCLTVNLQNRVCVRWQVVCCGGGEGLGCLDDWIGIGME